MGPVDEPSVRELPVGVDTSPPPITAVNLTNSRFLSRSALFNKVNEKSFGLMNVRFNQFGLLIFPKKHFSFCRHSTVFEVYFFFYSLHLHYFQVEDVNKMFDNLEELRNNNWKESIEPKDSPVSV